MRTLWDSMQKIFSRSFCPFLPLSGASVFDGDFSSLLTGRNHATRYANALRAYSTRQLPSGGEKNEEHLAAEEM